MTLRIAVAALLLIALGASFLVPHGEVYHVWKIPTFYAWFALGGCIALILGAKLLSADLLHRDADYYERLREEADGDVD